MLETVSSRGKLPIVEVKMPLRLRLTTHIGNMIDREKDSVFQPWSFKASWVSDQFFMLFNASKPTKIIVAWHFLHKRVKVFSDPSSYVSMLTILYIFSESSSGEIITPQDGHGKSPLPSILFRSILNADLCFKPYSFQRCLYKQFEPSLFKSNEP